MTTPPIQEELWAKYRNDRFLIVGFTERTGLSVASLFEAHAIRYRISEARSLDEIHPLLASLKVARDDVLCGPQGPEQLEGITRIILSPGVPRTLGLIAEAARRRIPVLGDIDFLYEFISHKKIVAITGTDGKTTTTKLASAVLAKGGKVVTAGNIGVPICNRYQEILDCDWLVLEMSSFMLEELRQFRANIACILNVAEDHTDRYSTIKQYAKVKMNLLRHSRPDDMFIHNIDNEHLRKMDPAHVRVRTMSRVRRKADYFFSDGAFWIREEPLRFADCQVRGEQNIENLLAAAAIGCEAGISPKAVAGAIRSFRGVPHRFEYLGRHRAVDVYNDSKATTIHAVDAALRNFECGVVLIVGGRDKGLDFSALREHAPRIKHLVCYGEAGDGIRRVLGFASSETVDRFEDAVRRAAARCVAGDILLLSPGCVSWDQYPDYEVRGAVFRDIALQSFHWEAERAQGAVSSPVSEALVQRLRKKVQHLTIDSRQVEEGSAFLAIPGQFSDGHRYIGEAIRSGAGVVIHEFGRDIEGERAAHPAVEFIAVPDPRELGKHLAPAFYGHPSREMKVVAVTGTNGKTTCSLVLERLQRALGRNPGVVNTLGIRYNDVSLQLDNVVPEPVVLQRTLRDMACGGVDALILELSSYALCIDRAYGVELDSAVLTNISQDHLDVHGTMANYVGAKMRLFDALHRSSKTTKTCGLWGGGRFFEQLRQRARSVGLEPIVFGLAGSPGPAELRADNIRCDIEGTTFDLEWKDSRFEALRTSLLGAFNVLDILAALSLGMDEVVGRAGDPASIRQLLGEVLGQVVVPGRLEKIPNDRGALIVVDYAHTEDGLLQVLTTLRAFGMGKLVTVFGCGGDRDRTKRARMGRVAVEHSDRVVVTSDNPRTEDPRSILREIELGMQCATERYEVVEDRREAIVRALSEVGRGDILLVAGKGHEQTQIVGDVARPLNDREVILSHV